MHVSVNKEIPEKFRQWGDMKILEILFSFFSHPVVNIDIVKSLHALDCSGCSGNIRGCVRILL